jgi:ribonuclease PH
MTVKKNEWGRTQKVRPVNLKYDYLGYADACALLEVGRTKVLASVTLQDNVPPFLRGQRRGWLTAEYAMLPCATQRRTNRESNQHFKNSRSVEISRLIGRCLRSVVDFSLLIDKTIIVDCDVLQADGGTRVACITAASFALDLAIKRWINAGVIDQNILKEQIAAISAGVVDGKPVLDLSYVQDNQAEADFNFVLTKSGKLIEVQGTAEKEPLEWELFLQLKDLAQKGVNQIFESCSKFNQNLDLNLRREKIDSFVGGRVADKRQNSREYNKNRKPALFSLGNRLNKSL